MKARKRIQYQQQLVKHLDRVPLNDIKCWKHRGEDTGGSNPILRPVAFSCRNLEGELACGLICLPLGSKRVTRDIAAEIGSCIRIGVDFARQ